MELPDVKQLKKLAQACRKAGIKTFKGFGFEFTLEDQPTPTRTTTKQAQGATNAQFESDTLSEEEMLFWSTGLASEAVSNTDEGN